MAILGLRVSAVTDGMSGDRTGARLLRPGAARNGTEPGKSARPHDSSPKMTTMACSMAAQPAMPAAAELQRLCRLTVSTACWTAPPLLPNPGTIRGGIAAVAEARHQNRAARTAKPTVPQFKPLTRVKAQSFRREPIFRRPERCATNELGPAKERPCPSGRSRGDADRGRSGSCRHGHAWHRSLNHAAASVPIHSAADHR